MEILDCTLRDGGYYTNWDFDASLVDAYVTLVNKLPIDCIEVGYRNKLKADYMGQFGYCPVSTLHRIRSLYNKRIAVMINEKDCSINDLQTLIEPLKNLVDIIRIAVDPYNFDRAIMLAKSIKNLGFEVSFNLMYMSNWDLIAGLYGKLCLLDDTVDVFCMVDSFGSMTPEKIEDTIENVKQNTVCKLGFHGHNNLQLALINTLTAIKNGVEVVDATILGMGRGAGNLNTELFLTYQNKFECLNVDFNLLGEVIQVFEILRQRYNWGTNLPYMLSGANSIPQKDVMEWVQNRIYSFNNIVRALNNRKNNVIDNAKYPSFDSCKKYDEILIVGGGRSVTSHLSAIKTFLLNKRIAIVFATARFASLFMEIECDKYYILVGNESKRLENSIQDHKFSGKCILPPYPRIMGTDVPRFAIDNTFELSNMGFCAKYNDSCTAIALEIASKISENCVYVVGYDGYVNVNLSDKELILTRENETLFEQYQLNHVTKLLSLTPTLYNALKVTSIYSYL